MIRSLSWLGWLTIATFVVATGLSGGVARAQGVTGAAVQGTITGEGVGPLETAAVQVRNVATGEIFSTVSGEAGRYFVDNVVPGRYAITVSFTGFPVTTQQGLTLTLGQKLKLDIDLKLSVEEVTVVEHLDVLQDRARSGPTTTVKQNWVEGLPLQGRNFTDLINTSPQVNSAAGSGSSIGGQNNRYNNIQIDGGRNNDIFGLAASGTPGGLANAKPLSIEAIDQFIIQIAPFDVRQGNFVGGLVNAITKSGTNEFHGSAFVYYQNRELTGNGLHAGDTFFNYLKTHCNPKDPADVPDACNDPNYLSFHVLQYGGSVGGPIIKDKLHFFAAFDLQDRTSSFGNSFQISGVDPVADKARAGFTVAEAQRFVSILKDKYGITGVGDALAPDIGNPDHNVFAKLSYAIDDHNRAELSYNFVDATLDQLTRAPFVAGVVPTGPTSPGNLRDGYQMSNSGYTQSSTTNSIRFKLTSHWGEVSNELLAGVSFIRDKRDIPQDLPLILVNAGTATSQAWLAAGGERFSQANILDQDIYQFQDNATFAIGGQNRITVGTSNEVLRFRNVFLQAATGAWAFNSLDDFEAGTAVAFQRRFGVSTLQDPGTAEFTVGQLGFYAQDEWTPIKNLTITPGIRVDIPILSGANTNPVLASNAAFPLDTSKVPTGNLLWSPRLGVNWDVEGDASTIVRGGAGIFTGEPPYVWVSNAYSINGLSQVQLTCAGTSGVPPFTPNPRMQPSDCAGGSGMPMAPTNQGEIDYFDPDTKYPQNFQAALGLDHRLPWDLIGSFDFLYSHDVNGWYVTDANLQNVGTSGEGRALYGTFAATGRSTPTRIDPNNLAQAVKTYNKSGGSNVSITVQLQKQISKILDVSAAYTYSRSQDLISLTSFQALSNFQFAPLDGSLDERNARPSAFDRPHKVTLTGTATLPYGFNVGVSYVGISGTPYTWLVNGDVNGDGVSNDLMFVPANPGQISLQDPAAWEGLNKFIDGQQCLADARGHFVERGACRNPWSNFLNLRVAWGIKIVKDQKVTLQWDLFNVLNLLNAEWGTTDVAATFENSNARPPLTPVGYDTTNNRPIYSFAAPPVVASRSFSPTSSRWRMQFGARFDF